jgi:hypothetical protein
MVDKNRSKFPHIKDSELQTRKKIVDDMEVVINVVKTGMESPTVRRKIEADEQKSKSKGFDESSSALYGTESKSHVIEKDNNR